MKNVEVVCAVIIKDNKVFCCQRGNGKSLEDFWEFPGGKIESGESKEEAIVREIKEELKTDVKSIKYLCTSEHTYSDMPPFEGFHIIMHAILCEVISGDLVLTEHKDSKWLNKNELDSVGWAAADKPIVEKVRKLMNSRKAKYPDFVDIDNVVEVGDAYFRYSLSIPFLSPKGKDELFVILKNPSTATSKNADVTISKVCNVAYNSKYSKVTVFNLFPFRATDATELLNYKSNKYYDYHFDKTMQKNKNIISEKTVGKDVLIAWGNNSIGTEADSLYDESIFKLMESISPKSLYYVKSYNCEMKKVDGNDVDVEIVYPMHGQCWNNDSSLNIYKSSYEKVWGSVGFVVNLSQMIEYNLANILALNEILLTFDNEESMYEFEYAKLLNKTDEWYKKLDKLELGKVLKEIKKKDIITEEFIKYLDEIRTERNFFVHNMFKEDLFTKEFQNNPKKFIPRLQELVRKMNAANEELVEIFDELKQEVKLIN